MPENGIGPLSRSAVGTPEAARQAGLSFRQLDYWARNGVITPTIAEADGQGTRRAWNTQDVRMLAAIGRVAADLQAVGRVDMTVELVDRLWSALNAHAHVVLTYGSVSISVGLETHIESEDS